MAVYFDSVPQIAGAAVFGIGGGFGVSGAQIASTGTDGPSPIYNCLTLPADAAKEYAWRIESWPAGGNGTIDEYGGLIYSGPNGNAVYRLFEDDVDKGTGTIGLTTTVAPPPPAPTGGADAVSTPYQTPVTINVLANDSANGDTLNPASVAIVAQGGKGVAVAQSNGTIIYTPNAGATGTDPFTYKVANSQGTFSAPITVTVTIGAAPPAPQRTITSDVLTNRADGSALANVTPIYWTFFPGWRGDAAVPNTTVFGSGATNGSGQLVVNSSNLPSAGTSGYLRVVKKHASDPTLDQVFEQWVTVT